MEQRCCIDRLNPPVHFHPKWSRFRPDPRASEGDCDLLIGYHHPQLPIALDPNHFPYLTLGVERIVPVSAVGKDGKPLFELPGKSGRPLPLLAYSSGAFLGNVVEMLLMNATEPYSLYRCFETHMSRR